MLRIRNVYPGSWFLPIPDAGFWIKNQQQKRGVKKNLLSYFFFVATNFTKFKIILPLKMLKKRIWANFQMNYIIFYSKIVTKLSRIWHWDPGSGKTYPGSRDQKFTDPGSGSATLALAGLVAGCPINYRDFNNLMRFILAKSCLILFVTMFIKQVSWKN